MPAYAGTPPPASFGWPGSLAWLDRRVNSLAITWLVYAGLVGFFGLLGLAFAHAAIAGG